MLYARPTSRRALAVASVVALAAAACTADRATAPAIRSAGTRAADRGGVPRGADSLPRVVDVRVAPLLPNAIAATIDGVSVFQGGFGSALDGAPGRDDAIYSMTDRGPNISGAGSDKIFPIPDYAPRIGRFRRRGDSYVRVATIVLRAENGTPLTGRPPAGIGNTGEIPKALDGSTLPFDPNGIDSEGLRVMWDGSFWVSDEYGPFLVHFDRWGRTIERNSPTGGPHPLPRVLLRRQPNKGMEGLASVSGGRVLVGMMQNPLNNPDTKASKSSSLLRIVAVDVVTGATKQYAYLLDDAKFGVSEIEAVSPTRFIVVERDGKFLGDPASPSTQKKLYLVDIAGATDISDPANGDAGLLVGGRTLEQLSSAQLAAAGIVPVKKTLLVDLLAYGYTHDKAEGIALLDHGRTIAVSNDDDFGVTDDNGVLFQKLLPSGAVDHNEVWFFHLGRSLDGE